MLRLGVLLFLLLSLSQASSAAPIRCQQIHGIPRLNAEFGIEQTVYRHGYFFRLIQVDSSRKDSPEYKRAEKYLNHDVMDSLRTLDRPKEFYDRLEETNSQILSRSWVMLIYSTRDTEVPIGGAAFVTAKDPSELLPMETELQTRIFGDKIETNYPIAEISRVGMNRNLATWKPARNETPPFQALVRMIAEVASTPGKIQHFFGFTTRVHQKMYQLLGHKTERKADPTSVRELLPGDVIIEVLR